MKGTTSRRRVSAVAFEEFFKTAGRRRIQRP